MRVFHFPKYANIFIIPAKMNLSLQTSICLISTMGLIASLPEIEKQKDSVFVMHEKSEKLIPLHKHNKGQLSYVEGGIAYITHENRTYVVPAKHYFWIPEGMYHILRIGYSATVLRSLYFYAYDDAADPYYGKLGIYPASELLIQMINYTERWDGRHVTRKDDNFEFLIALKKILPQLDNNSLP
ncbi:MAG TPA: AraC family ligand binding domain-containing protein, partial [Niastella sp.]|nr:AraC family ligand binding domain-containing protein [Niastella sp.]